MKTLSHVHLSSFRIKGLVWLLLAAFLVAGIPPVSFAQQPTATINILTRGKVLVNGQNRDKGRF